MSRYDQVTVCTVLDVEPSEEYEFLCTIQTPDRVVMWFGISDGKTWKIGCKSILGRRTSPVTTHFEDARLLAARTIREARSGKQKLNLQKVTPITRGKVYSARVQGGADRATAIFEK